LGEAGRQAVSEQFTAEAMARRTLHMFETVISNRKS
jgi:hypothetical protein